MNIRAMLIGGGLVASAVVGGAVGATFVNGSAGAQTATSTTTAPATPSSGGTNTPDRPDHGTPQHESAEKPVTGDNATKAKDAAVKSVGSGTAGDVTSDFTGDGYEVTVTKADGTQVDVRLDNSFNVQQDGHGGHGHGGPGGNDNDADSGSSSGSSSTTSS